MSMKALMTIMTAIVFIVEWMVRIVCYCCGTALPKHWSVLWAIHTLNIPQNYAQGVVAHPFNVLVWSARAHVGY